MPQRAAKMSKILLCADEVSLQNPSLLGLEGENLEKHSWLLTFSSGSGARMAIQDDEAISEAWVVSSNDVDGVNLAAAIKQDRKSCRVFLVAEALTGSAMSRIKAAEIDDALSLQSFGKRYAEEKRKRESYSSMSRKMPRRSALIDNGMGDVSSYESIPATVPQAVSRSSVFDGSVGVVTSQPSSQALVCSRKAALVTSVVSGSGGAGKSTIAAIAAYEARDRGLKTLLLDADFQFGDMAFLCGSTRAIPIDDLFNDPGKMSLLVAEDTAPAILAAPKRVEQAELYARELPHLFDLLIPYFDFIVVNTGATWTEQHAQIIERCTKTVFLIDQRASSIRAARQALELCTRCGIATGSFLFAVNRCSKQSLFSSLDIACALQGVHVAEIKDGGSVVEELLGAGMMGAFREGDNDLRSSVRNLLDQIIPADVGVLSAYDDSFDADAERKPRARFFPFLMDGSQRSKRCGKFRKHLQNDPSIGPDDDGSGIVP